MLYITLICLTALTMASHDEQPYCGLRYKRLCQGKGRHVACQFSDVGKFTFLVIIALSVSYHRDVDKISIFLVRYVDIFFVRLSVCSSVTGLCLYCDSWTVEIIIDDVVGINVAAITKNRLK